MPIDGVKWTDVAIVVLTLGLFIAALLQFGAALLQWKATNASVQIAEKALVGLERPHIFVRPQVARLNVGSGIHFVDYRITNFGRAPAVLRKRTVFAAAYQTIPTLPPYDETTGRIDWTAIAVAGDTPDQTETIIDHGLIPKGTAVAPKGVHIVFCGCIQYEDASGNKFWTKFGWVWRERDPSEPHKNSEFIAIDISGYNEAA